jgi:hypothetical protein
MIDKVSILTLTVLLISGFLSVLYASNYNLNHDPQSYILKKLKSHNIVFLGTKHKQPPILKFISDLIPRLHDSGVTHIGLEIESDQQDKALGTPIKL